MEPNKAKDSVSENDVKAPNILERGKEELGAVFHHDKTPHHHNENHGKNDDIDEGTPVEEVKAPGVFGRMKEEIEAVVEAIVPKKESDRCGRGTEHTQFGKAISLLENNVKSPNILERAKEELEAVFHHDKTPRHHNETHGRNDDIDEGTPVDEVKAPGVFERVKEEIEAVVETIVPKKESDKNDVKSPNFLERAKEELEAVFHHDKTPSHHNETHGRNDDIDEGTPVEEVKAPGVFERVKEEIEAVVDAITPKKESDSKDSPSK